jgi:hypothetical protein
MKVYVVPEGEIFRFASTLNKIVFRELNFCDPDGVICVERLSEAMLTEIQTMCGIWHITRDIVVDTFAGSNLQLSEIELIEILGYKYIRYWLDFFHLTAYPSVIISLSDLCGFVGYDIFYQLIHRLHFLTLVDKNKYKLSLVPSIRDLFEAMVFGTTSDMLEIYFKAIEFYGRDIIFNSVLSFLEKIITYMESPNSMNQRFSQYYDLIKASAESSHLYKMVDALHYLGCEEIPDELRIVLCFRSLGLDVPAFSKEKIRERIDSI